MTLIDIAAASHAVNAPQSTIRRWISSGWLARYGPKPYRVDLDELEKLAESLRRI